MWEVRPEGHWYTLLSKTKEYSLNRKQRKIFSHEETTLTQALWALYLLIGKCFRSKAHSCVAEQGFKDCAPETFFPNKQGYSRITTSVKKILESFGLHDGNHTPPSLPLIASPLPRPLDFYICNSDYEHQVASSLSTDDIYSPMKRDNVYKQIQNVFFKADYETISTERSRLTLKN